MDNIQSARQGEETPDEGALRATKPASVRDESNSRFKYKAFGIVASEEPGPKKAGGLLPSKPLNAPKAKDGSAHVRPVSAGHRPVLTPVPSRAVNLREAKEGLTLESSTGTHERRTERRAPSRAINLREAKEGITLDASPRVYHQPKACSLPGGPVNSREAKGDLAPEVSPEAHQRLAPSPVPAGAVNLREAKEGLTLDASPGAHERGEQRPVPEKSADSTEVKGASLKATFAPTHGVEPKPARPMIEGKTNVTGNKSAPPKARATAEGKVKTTSEAQKSAEAVKEKPDTHVTAKKKSAPPKATATVESKVKARPDGQKAAEAQKTEAVKAKPETPVAAKKKSAPAKPTPAPPAESAAVGPTCDLQAPRRKAPLVTIISYTLLTIVLLAGWLNRGAEVITAKEGTGYIIGIVGGAMMLLLVLYPLRKTAHWMRRMGSIKQWFRVHMVLGLVGPALILFHSNFAMGSLNSTIALVAMLLVAGSGLIGRYIYAKIHYGLYGKEMDLDGLRQDFEHKVNVMRYILDYAPALQERLKAFDARTIRPHYSFCGSILCLLRSFFGALRLRLVLVMGLRRTLRVAARRNQWSSAELKAHSRATHIYISNHISAAMAIARFKVYERLFSLWHILHLPLFLMLVLTAIIHVIAVHMF